MIFKTKKFLELSITELYEVLKLRSKVFVLEQNCAFVDEDDYDQKSHHVLGFQNEKILAYARIIPPGHYYKEASIGRVVTAKEIRLTGIGKTLFKHTVEKTIALYPNSGIRIMAQCYLKDFYANYGFVERGEAFIEDDILHIEMVLEITSKKIN